MNRLRRNESILGAILVALSVTACGGSGGGGGGPGPSPIPAPPTGPSPNLNDAEYQSSNSATTSNAISAYEAGATGNGVKVAVVDTGINPDLPEFTGRLDSASQDVAANRGIVDHQNHGTMVSGVIAANRDGQYMQGVAHKATILSLNVYDPAGCKPGNDCFLDSAIAPAIDLARTNGAKIINMSFGDEEGMTEDIWGAIGRAVDAGIIMVMSAGNSGTPNPNSFAVKNVQDHESSGLFIIAGAMDASRNIANFSDRAGTGIGALHYLTALGVGNATVNRFGQHVTVNGTSFSAPTIAGAAALLAGAFPSLSGSQIVSLLLSTADDAGTAGTDPTFGRGILNIERAFQPQGATTLAGSATPVTLTGNGMLSGPMGDATAGGNTGAIILDGYSRAYALNLARTFAQSAKEQPLHQALSGAVIRNSSAMAGPLSVSVALRRSTDGRNIEKSAFSLSPRDRLQAKAVAATAIARLSSRTAVALGFSQTGRALQQQLVGYAENAFLVARSPAERSGFHAMAGSSAAFRHRIGRAGLTLTTERGKAAMPELLRERDWPDYRLDSLSLDWIQGAARLQLGASRLREEQTVLGARFSNLFLSGGARTAFVDASVYVGLGGGWNAFATSRHGRTSVAGGTLLEHGRLSSSTFAFDLAKASLFAGGDKLAFRIMQPLRVSNGGFGLHLPVGYDYATRTPEYGRRFLNLAPSGREMDYEVAYGRPWLGGYVDANVFLRTEPGHIAAADPDAGAAIRFTLR